MAKDSPLEMAVGMAVLGGLAYLFGSWILDDGKGTGSKTPAMFIAKLDGTQKRLMDTCEAAWVNRLLQDQMAARVVMACNEAEAALPEGAKQRVRAKAMSESGKAWIDADVNRAGAEESDKAVWAVMYD